MIDDFSAQFWLVALVIYFASPGVRRTLKMTKAKIGEKWDRPRQSSRWNECCGSAPKIWHCVCVHIVYKVKRFCKLLLWHLWPPPLLGSQPGLFSWHSGCQCVKSLASRPEETEEIAMTLVLTSGEARNEGARLARRGRKPGIRRTLDRKCCSKDIFIAQHLQLFREAWS